MSRGCIQFILSVLLLNFCWLCSGYTEKVSKDYRKAAKRYRFKIRQDVQLPASIRGTVLSAKDAEKELGTFFEALDDLGSSFVKRSGLKQVVICRNLLLNGMVCAGVAHGDCIYLAQGVTKKVVFHEMFHVFDPKRRNKAWTDLNNLQFRYWKTDFSGYRDKKKNQSELARYYHSAGYKFAKDFVSNYAQTSEVEDRAETFAVMMAEGSDFIKRAKNSTVLYHKMLFIINLTGRGALLGRKFWIEKLGSWINDPPPELAERRK